MFKKHIYKANDFFLNSNKGAGTNSLHIKENISGLDFTKDFAIEFRWYYRDYPFTFPVQFRAQYEDTTHIIELRQNTNDRFLFYENVGGSFPNSLVVNGLLALKGTWIHVVATWEQGVGQRIYINGVKTSRVATATGNTQDKFSKCTLLGGDGLANTYNNDGAFKGYRIYNTSINDTQAAQLYAGQKETIQEVPISLQANLVREKLLNQKNGSIAIDSLNPKNNGTLVNLIDNKNTFKGGNLWKNVIAPCVVLGMLTGTYAKADIAYTSSIDPSITNLHARYAYDIGLENMPVVVIMHGNNGDASDITDAMLERFASYKFFAMAVGMRGRDGAGGSVDASGREIKDIVDAIEYVRTNIPTRVDPNKASIIGYSEGGANSLACLAKHPDYFDVFVAFFPPSDYGFDGVDSWYFTNGGFAPYMETNIGVRASDLNPYDARNHRDGIVNNMKGSYLYMFHDDQDTQVNVIQSQQLETEMNSASLNSLFELDVTTISDSPRWIHGLPVGFPLTDAEVIFKDRILNQTPYTYPTSGTVHVNGYLETKRFTIWLGDGVTESLNGTNRTATVIYNTVTDTYDVTPIFHSGATQTRVIITQGQKSINQIIMNQTVLVVV